MYVTPRLRDSLEGAQAAARAARAGPQLRLGDVARVAVAGRAVDDQDRERPPVGLGLCRCARTRPAVHSEGSAASRSRSVMSAFALFVAWSGQFGFSSGPRLACSWSSRRLLAILFVLLLLVFRPERRADYHGDPAVRAGRRSVAFICRLRPVGRLGGGIHRARRGRSRSESSCSCTSIRQSTNGERVSQRVRSKSCAGRCDRRWRVAARATHRHDRVRGHRGSVARSCGAAARDPKSCAASPRR